MSGAIGDLAKALAAAQSEIESVTADRTGQLGHRKYKYADLNACLVAVRAVLPKHGLAIVQRSLPSDGDLVRLETILMHESDQWIGSELCIKVANPTAQSIGSAITYARRYSLTSMLGLSVEDDDGKSAATPQAQHTGTTVDASPQKVNEITRNRITRACQDLDWSPEKLSEVLNKNGVAKLADMTQQDAAEFAGALEKKFLDQQGKEAFS